MLPTTVAGLFLFLVLVSPGYSWVRVEERHRPRAERSQVLELAELLVVGAVASAVSALIVSGIGQESSLFLNAHEWLAADDSQRYLVTHIADASFSFFGLLLIGNVGARLAALAWFRGKGTPGGTTKGGLQVGSTVWHDTFSSIDRKTHLLFLAVMQSDGSMVDGYLLNYAFDARSNDQELVLQSPIRIWRPGDDTPFISGADFAILPADGFNAVYGVKQNIEELS